jgi:hypothetical protein
MPFDPTLPLENTLVDAAQMRSQLQGLFDLIQAIPAGPPGPPGQDGGSVVSASVDAVGTLNPGDMAQAGVSWDGSTLHFTFALPRGNDGSNGSNGNDGGPGPTGPPGPSVANAFVDSVTTLNPGDFATVQSSFDGTNAHFTFGIPRGQDGANGLNGEVTNADLSSALSSAISGTSNNTNPVSTLGMSVSDPPTQSEMQAIANKLDELINALKR